MSLIEAPELIEEQVAEAPAVAPRERLLDRILRIPLLARIVKHIPPQMFSRYFVVGVWNTLFAYGSFAAANAFLTQTHWIDATAVNAFLTHWIDATSLRTATAYGISSPINFTVAYLGYKLFVFKTKGNYLREWLRCCMVYSTAILSGMVIVYCTTNLLKAVFHMDSQASYIAGGVALIWTTLYSFLGHSKFSFRPRTEKAKAEAA